MAMDDLDNIIARMRNHAASSPALSQLLADLDAGSYLRAHRFQLWCRSALSEVPRRPLAWLWAFLRPQKAPVWTVLGILRKRKAFRDAANQYIVATVLAREAAFFERVEKKPLTERQREACAVDESANLVIAGAGTGKTSTIVAKIGLLIRTGQCRADEILAISFTRKSANELAERIQDRLGFAVAVSTFHKLGSDIIGKSTGKKPNLANFADNKIEKTKAISVVIDQLSQSDHFKRDLIEFLAYYRVRARQAWDFKTLSEYQDWIRSNGIMSLDGVPKKSLEETVIANWLIMSGINFEYENSYEFDTAYADRRQYKPDFYLPDQKIYIEHFGLNAKGETAPHIDSVAYNESILWKRRTHAAHTTRLVETYSWQHANGTLLSTLQVALEQAGCQFLPQTLETTLDALNKAGAVDRFAELVCQFLTLYKGNGNRLTLPEHYESAEDRARVERFMELFRPIVDAYEANNRARQEIDFEDMITRATQAVRDRRYASPYRYILIDEFQDISPGRADLVRALQQSVDDCAIFAVGDDWQSIYRFAGSDIGAMTRFSEQFGPTRHVLLDQTFRFDDRIAQVSRKFILRNSVQIDKILTPLRYSATPSVVLYLRTPGVSPLLWPLQEIERMAPDGASVLILDRYRHQLPSPMELKQWSKQFPRLRFTAMSMHAAKGLEADYVLVGLRGGDWGFPSQLVDDALLDLVLTQADAYPHGEERRLFYVAMTRARFRTYLVADAGEDLSVFTQELLLEYKGEIDIAGNPRFRACPQCQAGILKPREGSGGRLLSCTHAPACQHSLPVCPQCRQGILELDFSGYWHCDACNVRHPACPHCVAGVLQPRKGPFSTFLGCSNFAVIDIQCCYTQSLE